jgi:hypothetical protein
MSDILKTRKYDFSETGSVCPQEREERHSVVFLTSTQDANSSSFRNAVFSSYSENWTMDKVHKPSDSECYTTTPELVDSTFYISSVLLV